MQQLRGTSSITLASSTRRWSSETAQRILILWIGLAYGACTPISAVGGKTQAGEAAAGAAGEAKPSASSDTPATSNVGTKMVGIATTADACSDEGAQACSGRGVRDVLVCRGGAWVASEPCKASERCQAERGPDQGTCVAMSPECNGQRAGISFCDGDVRKVCDDLITARVVECGNLLRCMPSATESAGCSCMMGAFDPGDGKGCQLATSCGTGNGGCDALTMCSMDGSGKPTCSVCPPPYVGDGSHGCIPQLVSLKPSCGELSPPFSSGVYEYQLKVPLGCQSLQLTAEAPPKVDVEIDGRTLDGDLSWSSELLSVGENVIRVAVTAASGKNSSYQLNVERRGVETDYIKASNSQAGDEFGLSVAAYGDTLVVGAPFEDSASGGVNGDQNNDSASSSGAVYVFVRKNDAWTQQAYLKADTPLAGDYFGANVAISRDTIIVGAPRNDPTQWGIIAPSRPGIAYAFVRHGETWSLEGTLQPTTTNRPDLFGFHVTVDGDTALVGAPDESNTGTGGGAVYAFTRSAGIWSFAQRVEPKEPITPSAFGFSVALQGDTFFAGAPQDATAARAAGSAYAFTRSNGKWAESKHFHAEQQVEQATFGHAVAILGTRALISAAALDLLQRPTPAGEVYLYDLQSGEWVQNEVLKSAAPFSVDLFGGAIALTDKGLLIGCNGDSSSSRGANGDPKNRDSWRSGAAYLFGQKRDERWAISAYLKASNADDQDSFSTAVTATSDMYVVGAPEEDGGSKGLDGDPSSNAASNSGAVYVYR